jgi:hypothetical protein
MEPTINHSVHYTTTGHCTVYSTEVNKRQKSSVKTFRRSTALLMEMHVAVDGN